MSSRTFRRSALPHAAGAMPSAYAWVYATVMLHEFLTSNRAELIDRGRAKVGRRSAPKATDDELTHGIPLFLDQLIKTLEVEQTLAPMRSREVSGASGGGGAPGEIGNAATIHGRELLQHGYTVDQVVHDYGDLCQAITDLAFELNVDIEIGEFRTLNRCLDNGIAGAVTEFNRQRDLITTDEHADALNQRLGVFAHELRNLLSTATLSLAAVRTGNVGLTGATGAMLDRSLVGMRNLIDRSLADVRVAAGLGGQHKIFSLADFIGEIQLSAALEARVRECGFSVSEVDKQLALKAHRELLLSAVGNLLQNAFKFTRDHGEVRLNAYAAADRIRIEVEDRCGGLPPGTLQKMFVPFTQLGSDRTGLGLGLTICRNSVEANGGILSVRDVPGSGCVFVIDLPRHSLPLIGASESA
jgi:signal transduction histidine kinase